MDNGTDIKVAGLLLCAGRSQRMATENKLLKSLKGKPVLQRTIEALSAAPFSEIIAVVGHQAPQITALLSEFSVPFVSNENYQVGLHSSIRKGLQSLKQPCAFFAVCLGDQPLLQTSDYLKLIESAQANPQAKLIYPAFEGQKGNPVLISFTLKDEVLAHPDSDRGCFYLFEKYSSSAVRVELSSKSALMDVDTPELFAEAEAWL